VTHHVEEIMPAFSHVLVLKKGQVLGCGPKGQILNSDLLSEAFGSPMSLSRRDSRYQLSVSVSSKTVI
jgi:iron complex transport system ATP-binding protein